MLLALELENHERPGHIPVLGILGKFDIEAVQLRYREQLRYSKLFVHLSKYEQILGPHFGALDDDRASGRRTQN